MFGMFGAAIAARNLGVGVADTGVHESFINLQGTQLQVRHKNNLSPRTAPDRASLKSFSLPASRVPFCVSKFLSQVFRFLRLHSTPAAKRFCKPKLVKAG